MAKKRNKQLKTSVPQKSVQDNSHVRTINMDKLHHKKSSSRGIKKNERLKPNFNTDTFTVPTERTYNTYMNELKNGTFNKDKAWEHHKEALKKHVVYEPIQDSDKIQRVMHKTFVDANIPVTQTHYTLTGRYTSADKSPIKVADKSHEKTSSVHQPSSSNTSQNESNAQSSSAHDVNNQVHVKKSDSRPVVKIHMPNLHVPMANDAKSKENTSASTSASAEANTKSSSQSVTSAHSNKPKKAHSSSADIESMIKLIENGKTLSQVEGMNAESMSQSQSSIDSSERASLAQANQSQASIIASSKAASVKSAKASNTSIKSVSTFASASSLAKSLNARDNSFAPKSSKQSLNIPNVHSLSVDNSGDIINYYHDNKSHKLKSNVYSASRSNYDYHDKSQNNTSSANKSSSFSSNALQSHITTGSTSSTNKATEQQAPGISNILHSAEHSSTSQSTSTNQNTKKLGFFKRHLHPFKYHHLKKRQKKQSLAVSAKNSAVASSKASLSQSEADSESASISNSTSASASASTSAKQSKTDSLKRKKIAKQTKSIGTVNFTSGETGEQMFKQAKEAYHKPNAGNTLEVPNLGDGAYKSSSNQARPSMSADNNSESTLSNNASSAESVVAHHVDISWSVLPQTSVKAISAKSVSASSEASATAKSLPASNSTQSKAKDSKSSASSVINASSANSSVTSKFSSITSSLSSVSNSLRIAQEKAQKSSASSKSANPPSKTDYQQIEHKIYERKVKQIKHRERKYHAKLRKQFQDKIKRHNHARKVAQKHKERILTRKAANLDSSAKSLNAKRARINSDLTGLHGSWAASSAKSSAAESSRASASRSQFLTSLKNSYATSYSSAKSTLTSSYSSKLAILSGYKTNAHNLNNKLTDLYQQSAQARSQFNETSAQKHSYSKRASVLNQQIQTNSIQYSKASSAAQSGYRASLSSNSASYSALNKANYSKFYHKISALKHQLSVSNDKATSAAKHASDIDKKWKQAQKSLNIDKKNNDKKIRSIKTKLLLSRRSEANGHIAQVKAARLRKALEAALKKQVVSKKNIRKAQKLINNEKRKAANAKAIARQTRIDSRRRVRRYHAKNRQLISINQSNSKILQMASHSSGQIKVYQQQLQKARDSYRHLWNIYQNGLHEIKHVETIRLKARRAYTMAHKYYIDNKKGRKKNTRLQNALKSSVKDSKQNMQNMADTEKILKEKIGNQTDTIALKNKRIRLIQQQLNRYKDIQMGVDPDKDPAVNGEDEREEKESQPINMNQYKPSHHFDDSRHYQRTTSTATRPQHREPSRINRHKHKITFGGLNKIFEAHKHNYSPEFYYKKAEVGDDVKLMFIKKYTVPLADGRKMVFSRGNLIPTYGIISGPKKAPYKTRFLIKNDQTIPALKSLVSLHK